MTDIPRRIPHAKPQTGTMYSWRWEWLAFLANTYGWEYGAELGVWKGKTFLRLLRDCPRLTLLGVDLWEPQPDNTGPQTYTEYRHAEYEKIVREGAEQYGERAIIYKCSTYMAAHYVADNSLDFVFVDADHSVDAVRNDITTWRPKLREGGRMIGHDINWPEVREVVEELCPDFLVGPDNCWIENL